MNSAGTRIWSKAEEGKTLSQILADLQKTYQVPAEKLAADLTPRPQAVARSAAAITVPRRLNPKGVPPALPGWQ